MVAMKRFALLEILFLLLLLGCGENTTSESISMTYSEMQIVADVENLPECEEANEGVEIWVKSEQAVRVCLDEKWFAKKSRGENDSAFTIEKTLGCEAVPLNKYTAKVLCNGDSIGVFTYKQEPENLEIKDTVASVVIKDGVGCTIEDLSEYTIRVVCGADSMVFHRDSTENVVIPADTVEVDSEKVVTFLDTVSGSSQKGPFLRGTEVVVYELEDGRTLKQTGYSFNGNILNDNGDFKVNARALVSQYISLETTGFYRNEVTGENSDSKLALFAITDVSERQIVNVNLLTHLEYERVHYLVTNKKMRVKQAKKQAQAEIFGLLGIDASGFSDSEDLNIAGSSDEDGALLAFSVMFQGDRSVAQLSDVLTKLSVDLEKDGVWSDSTVRKEIANWSANADCSGRLDSIRRNVENWKLASMVPNFEKHIRHFWYTEYGLDECSAKNEDVVVSAKKGVDSDSTNRYICKSDTNYSEGYRWMFADNLEKDTYGWEPDNGEKIKLGAVTGNLYYIFDLITKKWRLASAIELKLGGCSDDVAADITRNTGSVEGVWYRCKDLQWKETSELFVDTQGWPAGTDSEIKKGDSTSAYYVYDEIEGYWRTASALEKTLGLGGCTVKRKGDHVRSEYNQYYYGCSDKQEWTAVSDRVGDNTVQNKCDEEGKMLLGLVNPVYFVCDASLWREATIVEEQMKMACTKAMQGRFNSDSTQICDSTKFRRTNIYDFGVGVRNYFNPDIEYGELVDERDGRVYKTVQIGDQEWMAENLNYADEWRNPYLIGNNFCYKDDTLNCLKGGRYYHWNAVMDIDEKWNQSSTYDWLVKHPHRGICPEGWHVPEQSEWLKLDSTVNYASLQAKTMSTWSRATNASGFTALQTEHNSWLWTVDTVAVFWGVSPEGYRSAFKITANGTGRMIASGTYRMSVRCIKD